MIKKKKEMYFYKGMANTVYKICWYCFRFEDRKHFFFQSKKISQKESIHQEELVSRLPTFILFTDA